jgi:hypothetical protein
MSKSLTLSNGGVRLSFSEDTRASHLLERLSSFLAPCFAPVPEAAEPDLRIVLRDAEAFGPERIGRCSRPMQIRLSHAPGFSLQVMLGEDDCDQRLAWDGDTRVGYRIDAQRRTIEFFAGDNGFIHLIELVRYYGLRAEQARGSCVLHASAVADARTGAVTAIAGLKGAGKTTTMFSMVASGRSLYFSGDKLLLDVHAGGVRARAWPDFPYIGAGTLRTHPELTGRLGLSHVLGDDSIADRRKFLVDPLDFRRAMPFASKAEGPLGAVVVPQVDHSGPARAPRLSGAEVAEALAVPGMFEWPHEFPIATWHGVVPHGPAAPTEPSAELLRRLRLLPWTRRDGLPADGRAQ